MKGNGFGAHWWSHGPVAGRIVIVICLGGKVSSGSHIYSQWLCACEC